jgi:putative thiamine transport system permease protein
MIRLAFLPLALLFVLPVLAAAWAALFHHPQLAKGITLSICTGSVATLCAISLALGIAASFFERGKISWLSSYISAMLAVPHLAFAIGFGFLIMPSGLLVRVLALITGWQAPPQWITTHDPFGIALTTALIAKEAVFLIFVLIGILTREDIAQSFKAQKQSAVALGYSTNAIWLRLFIPQLVPHLLWPLVIVFVYAATVVDMSLVLGPTQPPVFADVVWADINSADPANNARGAAGAVFISMVAAAVLALIYLIANAFLPMFKRWITRGPAQHQSSPFPLSPSAVALAKVEGRRGAFFVICKRHALKWQALKLLFLAVILTLVILSFAALWPFPNLLPQTWSADAWRNVAAHSEPLITSLALALATSLTGLGVLVLWLENMPKRFDRYVLILCVLVLGLPALLTGLGQYQLFLRLGFTGTLGGLFLAHLMPVVAYMFIMLNGPYRNYENKWRAAATGLMAPPFHFLAQIKWPMLKAPLLASAAVGFAVSFAQFVPAQLVAAGRYSTLPIEAVTLSSGSNRALTAAFALLLMLPPLLVFLSSGILSKSRWGNV